MNLQQIEQHFLANRQRYVKKYTFKAGTPEDAEDIVQTVFMN
jgi:DNA-directed RNA polymerase specialized sigma24 family protein